MLKLTNFIWLAIAILYLAGCSTISNFEGKALKPNQAIVILYVQPGNFLWARSEGMLMQLMSTNTPIVLTVEAGEFELQQFSQSTMFFNPELKIKNIKPGTVNYIGNVLTSYDFVNNRAGVKVLDLEQKTVDEVKTLYPDIFTKYKYQKDLLEPKYSDFGSAKDYVNFPIPQPSKTEAVLVIYRPVYAGTGSLVTAGIRIGDVRVVGLEIGDYTYFKVPAGDYKLTAEMGLFQGDAAQNTVSLSAGEAYFYVLRGVSVFKRVPIPIAVEELKNMDYEPLDKQLPK